MEDNSIFAFGSLINALNGGGDAGNIFPSSDVDDFSMGVRFVPGGVTLARRRGEQVDFIRDCGNPCCWYWQFQNGSREYHWERGAYERIKENGSCPSCGNKHIEGGHIDTSPPNSQHE